MSSALEIYVLYIFVQLCTCLMDIVWYFYNGTVPSNKAVLILNIQDYVDGKQNRVINQKYLQSALD